MLSQILWWAGNLVISFLLARCLRGRFFTKYPVFYFYLSYVLLESLLRFYVYVVHASRYESFYWYTQFLSVALGYCVIWEIYTQALADYPGVARMARIVLLAVFVVVVAQALVHALSDPVWSAPEIPALLERNLRTAQALLLVGIVGLLLYYAIPVGRNLRGMILGYGLFISASVISLTLRSHLGKGFEPWWHYFQPMAYFAALLIWAATLWSYQPNPQPRTEIKIEPDYELLSEQTAKAIAWARSYLLRTVRP